MEMMKRSSEVILKEREKASNIVQQLEGYTYGEAFRILDCAQRLLKSKSFVTSENKE